MYSRSSTIFRGLKDGGPDPSEYTIVIKKNFYTLLTKFFASLNGAQNNEIAKESSFALDVGCFLCRMSES
jgi:hypothetical protein